MGRADLLGTLIIKNTKEEAERLIREKAQERDVKEGSKEVVWRKSGGVYKSYIRKHPTRESNKQEEWQRRKMEFNKSTYDEQCIVTAPKINLESQYVDKAIEKALKEWQNYYGIKARIIKK